MSRVVAFLSDHPLIAITVYILVLTVVFTYLVEWRRRRRWKKWMENRRTGYFGDKQR